jgi:hypothetical protein
MNSLIFSSQNKITTIISVLWEYTNNGGASYQDLTGNISPTYNGTAFTIRVKSVTPAEATYSQTGTASITNVADTTAQLTITGTNPYTGSYTSPTITITAASISGTAANPSVTYNGTSQSGAVITGVLPTGATYSGSVNATGTDYGGYTSSISGTGNYTGSVSGGTFTINKKTINGTFIADYGYDSGIFQYVINSVTFGGGAPNAPFNDFQLSQSGGDNDPPPIRIPVTFSGTFDGAGNYTYTFSGGSAFITSIGQTPVTLTIATTSSTNYTGSSTCVLT